MNRANRPVYYDITDILSKTLPNDGSRPLYLVRFTNTWEPIANLGNCRELLNHLEPGLPRVQPFDVDNDGEILWLVQDILETRYDQNNNVSSE